MTARKDEAVGVGGTGASNWSEPTKSSSMGLKNHIPSDEESQLVEMDKYTRARLDTLERERETGAAEDPEFHAREAAIEYDPLTAYISGEDLPPEGFRRRGRPKGAKTDKAAAERRKNPESAVKPGSPEELKAIEDEYAKVRAEAESDIRYGGDADKEAAETDRPRFAQVVIPWEEAERLERKMTNAGKLQNAYIKKEKRLGSTLPDKVLMLKAQAEHPGLTGEEEERLNRFWAEELEAERQGYGRDHLRQKRDLATMVGEKPEEDDLAGKPTFKYGKEGKTGLQHFQELHPEAFQNLLKKIGKRIQKGMFVKVSPNFPKPAVPQTLSSVTPGYDKRKVHGYYLASLLHQLADYADDDGSIFWVEYRNWDTQEIEDGTDFRLEPYGDWIDISLLEGSDDLEADETTAETEAKPETKPEVDTEREEMKADLKDLWRMHSFDPKSGFEAQKGLEDISPLEFSGRKEAAPGGDPEPDDIEYPVGLENLGDPDERLYGDDDEDDEDDDPIPGFYKVPKGGPAKPPGPFDAPEDEWPEYVEPKRRTTFDDAPGDTMEEVFGRKKSDWTDLDIPIGKKSFLAGIDSASHVPPKAEPKPEPAATPEPVVEPETPKPEEKPYETKFPEMHDFKAWAESVAKLLPGTNIQKVVDALQMGFQSEMLPRSFADSLKKRDEETGQVYFNDIKEQIKMRVAEFFINEAHGERAERKGHGRSNRESSKQQKQYGSRPVPSKAMGPQGSDWEDPTSSKSDPNQIGGESMGPVSFGGDEGFGDGGDEEGFGGGTTMDVPQGVFQDDSGPEGFGDMDQVSDEEGGEPMPGGPEDPEMTEMPGVDPSQAGMQGAGFEQESTDGDPGFGQTGEPNPGNKIIPQMPEYEGSDIQGPKDPSQWYERKHNPDMAGFNPRSQPAKGRRWRR